MHFIVSPIGSAGDVHPFLGLAVALQQRGHRVTVVVNDDREGAEIDFEGDTYDLAWDRRENKACNCRSYENESFVATVTFPTETSDGKVDIRAKSP